MLNRQVSLHSSLGMQYNYTGKGGAAVGWGEVRVFALFAQGNKKKAGDNDNNMRMYECVDLP